MSLINSTHLKAQITENAFFVQMVKAELGKGRQLCSEKKKQSFSASHAERTRQKLMRNCCDTSHKGTVLMVLPLASGAHLHCQSSPALGKGMCSVPLCHHL